MRKVILKCKWEQEDFCSGYPEKCETCEQGITPFKKVIQDILDVMKVNTGIPK